MKINTKNSPSFFNYLFVSYYIVWEAVRVFIINLDGYGRLGMILLLMAVIMNFTHTDVWHKFKIPAVAIWLTWVIVEFIHWFSEGLLWEGNPDKWYFTYYNFIRCLAALVIATVEMNRNAKRFLRVVLYSFITYVIMGIVFQMRVGESLRSDHSNLLGNFLPLASLVMVATSMISYYLAGISKRMVWVIFALSIVTIMACATRKAFGGIVILFIIWYFNTANLWKPKNLIIAIFGCLALFFAMEYVMEYTTIGERFTEIDKQSKAYQDNIFLKFTGDRAVQYLLGWNIFLQHPLLGVGLLNFQYYSGFPFQLHTEYMVQLCECGIVGFSLFIMFYIAIIRQIIRIRHKYSSLSRVFIGCMGCTIFLNFTAWSFNFPSYFIMYGVIIGGCVLVKKKSYKVIVK